MIRAAITHNLSETQSNKGLRSISIRRFPRDETDASVPNLVHKSEAQSMLLWHRRVITSFTIVSIIQNRLVESRYRLDGD